MQMKIVASGEELAQAAAHEAADVLRGAIARNGTARLIAATGVTQFRFLEVLTALPGIDWGRVELFHLDEYLGLPEDHPASFRRFLRERLVGKTGIRRAHLLDGTADPEQTIRTVTKAIREQPIDLAFLGVGENGHLAFNDPPADFETEASYIVVALDDACRRQQLGEGWFPSFEAVPTHAISMTIREILKARKLLALVPGQRKAEIVARCFNGEVSPLYPASILRRHANGTLYLDQASASLLTRETVERYTS